MIDWNAIASGAIPHGDAGSEHDNLCHPDHKIEVVVEKRVRTRVEETWIVTTYVNGEARTSEIMPGGASGKEGADAEVRKVARLCRKNGYTLSTKYTAAA